MALGALILVAAVPRARAQEPEPAPIPADVEETIARALYDRAVELYQAGRYREAQQLLAEAIARSPQGATAPQARRMLARAEMKVKSGGGPDDMRGTVDEPVDEVETLDPYSRDEPIDPYDDTETDGLVDEPGPNDIQRVRLRVESERARRNLVLYGGAYGTWNGIAVAGLADAEAAALVLVLTGAGLGMGGTYLLVRDRTVTEGQANAVMSGATWGSIDGLLLAWAARDLRSDPEASYEGWWGGTILGGLVGLGGGLGYAFFRPSPGDVAAVNSLTGYGMLGGFLVGGIMDPPYSGAYGLNGAIGSAVGIAGGLYLASEVEVSRQRMALVDLGALVGAAAPWVLVYPLITEGTSSDAAETNDDEQVASFLSLATMGIGIGLSWWWTRDFDARRRGDRAEGPPLPALLGRSESGRWSLGMPALRLSPPSAPERAVTVDLLGGSW